MGFSSISPWSLLLILMIAIVIFGTKNLKKTVMEFISIKDSLNKKSRKNDRHK